MDGIYKTKVECPIFQHSTKSYHRRILFTDFSSYPLVGWNEASQTIVVVPTVPDLSGCGDPAYYRRSEILKAYRNKYPTDAFVIYPDKKGYIGINAYDWLEDEKLFVYVSQAEELTAFTDFFMNRFAAK